VLWAKVEIGKPQNCPEKTRIAHNPWAKCHISAFDRANLVMTNLIWAKLYTDFYRKGKRQNRRVLNTFTNIIYKQL